jgi:hypothetical protein
MSDVVSFSRLLELGVKKLAATGNGIITNGSSLEMAFALGVLEYKSRLQKRRAAIPNSLSDSRLNDVVFRIFQPSQVAQDSETKSYEINLSPTEKLPLQYAGYELHIFHDGSTDAHRTVMQYIYHLWFQLSPRGYATLELIGELDARVPAALLNFYSDTSKPMLDEIVSRFQGIIAPEHTGYAVEYLYPKPLENNTYLASMGALGQIRQDVFKVIWTVLFNAHVFYWEDFATDFTSHMKTAHNRLTERSG